MQFFINPEKMAGRVSELDSIQGELGKLSSSLESIINTNAIQLDSFNQIKRALRNYQQNIRVISGNTAQMSAGLQNVVKEYMTHEQSICEHAGHGSTGKHSGLNRPWSGFPLIWSGLFPSAIVTIPLIPPIWGAIGSGIGWLYNNVGKWGYNDSTNNKFSWSILGGKTGKEVDLNGINAGYNGEYHAGHVTANVKGSANWDVKKGNIKATTGVKAGISALDGKVSGNIGIAKGTLEGSLINASAEGAIGFSILSDGKFAPSVYGEVSAKANVAEGKVSSQFGTDEFNYHNKAEGTLLEAEAKASAKAGRIVEKDGTVKYGVSGKAGAEAYLAKGSVSGGFTLFGIKFDASVEGKAGGAGAKIGGEATTGAVEGEIGLGLGLGLGIKVKIDWTGFKWPW